MAETDWNNAHISANLSGILSRKKQEFSSEYYEEGIEKNHMRFLEYEFRNVE